LRWAAGNREELRALRSAVVARMRSWSPEQNIAATVAAVRIAVSRIAGEEPEDEADSATHAGTTGPTNAAAHAHPGKLHE
jgi:hypothetical protein